ncbi:hypothetical protein [uncultured Sphingomonas sp.]|uniref:hypothetical protein n=1 Tax=uncultured Sphingomonas sp. TaxID=158754 RepID=UPI0025EE6A18|nr:hypothetical protein [uncultured Sphingomonas sp.]
MTILDDAAGRLDLLIGRIGERRLALALVLLCVLLRFAAALWYKGVEPLAVENQMVAVALAEHHGYAGAFRPDSGPTAHTGPVAPLLMAAVYAILGVETPAAEVVLDLLGAASIALTFLLAYACFTLLDIGRTSRLLALAFLCVVPMQISLEGREASVWEFGYVGCALFGLLLIILNADLAGRVRVPVLVGIALGVAALEVLSPSAGLASAGALGLLLLRRTRWPMWIAIGGLTLLFYVALTTPWAMRNQRVLGEPIRSRSSFGLSFAIGFYPGQITNPDERAANVDRLVALHPHSQGGPGYALMNRAGGEVAYNRKLAAETQAWVRTHRSEAAFIAARNLQNFFFPPPWLWDRWETGPIRFRTTLRALATSVMALAGLLTLGWVLWARRWRFLYLAAVSILVAAPYIASFALLRYRFPVGVILTFLAFAGVGMVLSRRRTVAAAIRSTVPA